MKALWIMAFIFSGYVHADVNCNLDKVTGVTSGDRIDAVRVDFENAGFSGHYGNMGWGNELSTDQVLTVVNPIVYSRRSECLQVSDDTNAPLIEHSFTCAKSDRVGTPSFDSTLTYNLESNSGVYTGLYVDEEFETHRFTFEFSGCE